MLSQADVARKVRIALILRARRVDVHKGVREVQDPAYWGLPLHTPIAPGARRLTEKQRAEFASLTAEERPRYIAARDGGKVTHAAALKAVRTPARKAAAPQKATPSKRAPAKKAARPPAKPIPIRELFEADDATIEAALRDVYEGRFGPYTTKVKVHILRPGQKDSRGRDIEPSIGVEGKVYTTYRDWFGEEREMEIGYFGRSISPVVLHYNDGRVRREIWVKHSIVQLGDGDDENGREDTRYHGKGFGGAFNQRAIEWYRASGVHGIGQSDHNGYVWASQGFNFDGGVVPDYLVENMRGLIADLRAGRTKSDHAKSDYSTIPKRFRDAPDLEQQIAAAEALLARLNTTKPGEPGYPTAYEISQLGRRAGQRGKTALWLGKLLYVSAGEMVLNPDEGEVVERAARVRPDTIVVQRHNDLADLYNDFAIRHGDDPDYDPDDDREFVAKARRIMGIRTV